MVEANLKIIAELKLVISEIVNCDELKSHFISNQDDFSRKRKLTIEKLIVILINMPKRSLSIELKDIFGILEDNNPATKAAFCLQRTKLLPIFFQVWNRVLVDCYYIYHQVKIKYWKGLRLIAVDGSSINLINKEEVINYYGTHDNQFSESPMARVVQSYDLLNEIIIFSNLYPIKTSEKKIVSSIIHQFYEDSITIFDRGFPSFELMYLMINEEKPKPFVIRCNVSFNTEVKQFMCSKSKSKIVALKPNQSVLASLKSKGHIIELTTSILVRMVKVKLASGITEILLTNLYDEQLYSNEDLKYLYSLRWGIETSYGTQKNQLQIEQFSGHRVICIQQDFHASVFVANLQSIISKQCDEHIEQINLIRKHKYKINRNVSWGSLKHNIVKLFIENNPKEILLKLQYAFQQNIEPIRKNRVYERKIKVRCKRGKYRTLTNYKRAI